MPDEEIVTPGEGGGGTGDGPISPSGGSTQSSAGGNPYTRKQLIAMGFPVTPLTREEALLANAVGGEYEISAPLTAKEQILVSLAENGGGIEGLSDWETVNVLVVNGSNSNYIGFKNVFAGSDVNNIAFYGAITSKQLASNGYSLFFPISENTKHGLITYGVYGSLSATPSATDEGHEGVTTGTFSGSVITDDVVAISRTVNDSNALGLTFTLA